MAVIDPDGLFNGERIASCSDLAQLYWPRLFLGANTFGRLELSYPSISSKVFGNFQNIPKSEELWEIFREFEKNFLAILYEVDGVWWCQFITDDRYLPKYKMKRDEKSPKPGDDLLAKFQSGYAAWKARNSLSRKDGFKTFQKSSGNFT